MKLHPVAPKVLCLHCSGGPLTFVSEYARMGDKYACANCRRTMVHRRAKNSERCGLSLVERNCFLGPWQGGACESSRRGSMSDPLSELVQARYQAAGGATDEAQRHIAESLELLDDALDGRPGPKPSARSIRAYLNNARAAVKSGDARRGCRGARIRARGDRSEIGGAI